MEQQHKDFLKEHYNNYETVQNGYMRNVDMPILKMYEHIYRLNLDPSFVLTHWCGNCKMDMVNRLYKFYESLPGESIENPIEGNYFNPEPVEIVLNKQPKKRGRKPKNNG